MGILIPLPGQDVVDQPVPVGVRVFRESGGKLRVSLRDGAVPGVCAGNLLIDAAVLTVLIEGVGPEAPGPALVVGPVRRRDAVFIEGHGGELQEEQPQLVLGVVVGVDQPLHPGHARLIPADDELLRPVAVQVRQGEAVPPGGALVAGALQRLPVGPEAQQVHVPQRLAVGQPPGLVLFGGDGVPRPGGLLRRGRVLRLGGRLRSGGLFRRGDNRRAELVRPAGGEGSQQKPGDKNSAEHPDKVFHIATSFL